MKTTRALALLAAVVLLPNGDAQPDENKVRPADASTIRADEQIVFFPTAAYLSRLGDEWRVPIHGWILEREGDDLFRNQLMKVVREEVGEITDKQSLKLLDERVRWFLVDNEGGKRIAYNVAGRSGVSAESGSDGHFVGLINVPVEVAKPHTKDGWLDIAAVLPESDKRRFIGRSQLLAPTGWLVISDIDDTVKISEVTNKKKLIEHTFLRPFEAAPGMPELYRKWAKAGADFHFVSSSPWQLYPPLSEFFEAKKFPAATFSLKQIHIKGTSILKLIDDPWVSKVTTISEILKRFPDRKIVLVGDSGEKDPEVYGELARQFPEQVKSIFIRNVTQEKTASKRMQTAFREVDTKSWQLFVQTDEIKWSPQ